MARGQIIGFCTALLLAIPLAGSLAAPASVARPIVWREAMADPWSDTALQSLLARYRADASLGTLVRQLRQAARLPQDERPAGAFVLLARVLESLGDRQGAAAALGQASAAGDRSVKTLSHLATLHEKLGNSEAAHRTLLTAAKQATRRQVAVGFYARLGAIEAGRGRRREALGYWKKLIEIEGGTLSAHRAVADLMLQQDYAHDAIDLYLALAKRAKDPLVAAQAHLEAGAICEELDLRPAAKASYRSALTRLAGDHWLRYDLLARLIRLEADGDRTETLDRLAKELAVKPNNKRLRLLLTDSWIESGQSAKAIAALTDGLDRTPDDAELGRRLVALLQETGNKAAYLTELRRQAARPPRSPAQQRALAAALFDQGHGAEAEKLIQTLLAASRASREIADIAQLYADAGKQKMLLPLWKQAADLEREGHLHRLHYLGALLEAHREEEAMQLFAKLLKKDLLDQRDLERLMEDMDGPQSIALLQKATSAQPDRLGWRQMLAEALWAGEQPVAGLREQAQLYERVRGAEREPIVRAAANRLASLQLSQATAAIIAYNKDHQPNGLTLTALGFAFEAAGQPSRAVTAFKQAIQKDPTLLIAHRGLATAYLKGQPPEHEAAVKTLERMATLDKPNRLVYYQEIGDSLLAAKRPKSAETYWRRIEAEMPDDPYLLLRLADRHRKRGNHDQVLRDLQRAAGLPNSPPDVHRRLAGYYSLGETPHLALPEYEQMLLFAEDPKERNQAAEKLTRVAFRVYRRRTDAAAALAAKGEAKAAARLLTQAIHPMTLIVRYGVSARSRSTARLRLAALYQQTGDLTAAAQALAQVALSGTTDPVLARHDLEISARQFARGRLQRFLARHKTLAPEVADRFGLTFRAAPQQAAPPRLAALSRPQIGWTLTPPAGRGPIRLGRSEGDRVLVAASTLFSLAAADKAPHLQPIKAQLGLRAIRPIAISRAGPIVASANQLVGLTPDGKRIWTLTLPHEAADHGAPQPARVAFAGDLIVVATAAEVFTFNVITYEVPWRARYKPSEDHAVVASIVLDRSACYILMTDGAVRPHSMVDGSTLWARAAKRDYGSLAIGDKIIYALSNKSGTVAALDRKTGKELSTTKLPLGPLAVAAATAGTDVIWISESGLKPRVFAYNTKIGTLSWSLPIPSNGKYIALTRPVVAGTMILVGTSDGRVIALQESKR